MPWSVCIVRKEGVTQDDPLSMFMYLIDTLPLICSLQTLLTGMLLMPDSLHLQLDWSSIYCSCGPAFGYFPQSSMSFVATRGQCRSEAEAFSPDTRLMLRSGSVVNPHSYNLPGNCDVCGTNFTIEYALDCRFGGLVTRRQKEVRDAFGELVFLGLESRAPGTSV